MDESETRDLKTSEYVAYVDSQDRYRLRPGSFSSFHITPSCPLCRLIYRVVPRSLPDHDTTMLTLTPFRWYIRQDHWEAVPKDEKRSFAVWFGFSSADLGVTGPSFFDSSQPLRTAMMTGEAIALHSATGSSPKESYDARLVDEMIDFEHVRKGLEHCQKHHSETCQPKFDKGMLATRMVDVNSRTVVPCPDECDYLALSYVWGGINPAPGALEEGTLPQTIEDAITITKKLGRRYLWVGSTQSADNTSLMLPL